MAMTAAQQLDSYKFFIIAFGAAPGVVYMDQLNDAYAAGMTTKEIVNVYTDKPQFTALYPKFLTSEQFATSLVNNIVKGTASDEAKAEAVADIQAALASGMTRGDVIFQVFNNLTGLTGDAKWGTTADLFNNEIAVAKYYTEVLLGDATDVAVLHSVVSGVTATTDTSPAAIDAMLAGPVVRDFALSVGQDNVSGSSFGDLFTSLVVQNTLGAQVNTLGSGDMLDGRGGLDTLHATVTSGSFIGGSLSMPIQPKTASIEVVKLEAVSSDIDSNEKDTGNNNTQVYVNAKNMVDVQQLWSSHSDADLVIQNLTSQGLANVSDMTIGMEYSGNADTRWGASDTTVYFDQDYLTTTTTRTSPVVNFLAMNEDNYDATVGAKPLDGVFFRQLQFKLNDVYFDLKPGLNESAVGTGSEITTYAQFLTAVQVSLAALKAANPTNASLQTVQASLGDSFKTDVDPITLVQRTGQEIRLTADGVTGTTANTLEVASTDIEVARAAEAVVPNNNRYERADSNPSAPVDKLVSINVALEKVGLAGDGGELIIGSMNKHEGNDWDAVNTTTKTVSGIQEFNVVVNGANDKSSSLAGLHSTNNNLRVVTVATDAALTGTSFADLTIGNSNTVQHSSNGGTSAVTLTEMPSLANQYALKDVQVFDASAFKGDLSLHAALTNQVTAKYLNVVDGSPAAPAADNVNFAYTGGTGNDYINLHLSGANLAKPGTASREDMTLTVNGGQGNDEIVVKIGNGSGGEQNSTFWYENQHSTTANLKLVGALATGQLQINGGEGNDTVRKMGAGDFAINGGAGNDTIYAENTGTDGNNFNAGRGVAVFNALNSNPNNLESDNHTLTFTATTSAKVNVTVNFLGFEKTVEVTSTGQGGEQTITDLMINQAIKTAVNADPVLQKLAIAEDGPGHTLVLRSLIDGDLGIDPVTGAGNNGNYSISLSPVPAAGAFSAVNLLQLHNAFGTDTATGVYANNPSFSGANDVDSPSDNLIVGGLGDDVIVLGTAGYHSSGAELDGSNDTLVWTGFGNGSDSIVNFDTGLINGDQGMDYLDFSAYKATVVQVGTAFVVGTTLPTTGVYITMTEGTGDKLGSYTINEVNLGATTATTDDVTTLIGVADFGHTQVFQATNFII